MYVCKNEDNVCQWWVRTWNCLISVIHSLVVSKPHTVNTVSTCCVSLDFYVKWKIKASKDEHAATC